MARIDQPILVDTEDPEYYAELLSKTCPNRCLLSNETLCSDIPGVQGVDDPSSRRLQTLLDVVADISLRKQGNASATMACIKANKGALETQVYIAFNHNDDGAASNCPVHLQSIFDRLSCVPYRPHVVAGSPKGISSELEGSLFEVCTAIHNYSFDLFAYRVNKRKHKLSDIRSYIEQEKRQFNSRQRSMLLEFLLHVESIIKVVTNAQTTKQLSSDFIRVLVQTYSFWTTNGLLPQERLAGDVVTLLDHADAWLADTHGIGFRLRRWAVKIMSFVISANRLFMLTQSCRLRKIIDGTFAIKPLSSPTTTPYRCNLSSKNIRVALDAALHQTKYSTAEWYEDRESFIVWLRDKLKDSEVCHWKPTVHAELVMITAMLKGELQEVLPYIGVSKLSCIMCIHYIQAFNEVTGKRIAVKGSHGKAYPGWSWPSLPSHDREVCRAFLELSRQQLWSDFNLHVKSRRGRLGSDNSMGSRVPRLESVVTADEIREFFSHELSEPM